MLSLSEILSGIAQIFKPYVSSIKNVLPASLRFQGRIYQRSDIQTPEQLGWYISALALAAPQTVTAAQAALQRSAGMPYDGVAAYYCDSQNRPSYAPHEIDPITITIIITIISAILKQAPAILQSLMAPPSTPATDGKKADVGDDEKSSGISPQMLMLIALLVFASK